MKLPRQRCRKLWTEFSAVARGMLDRLGAVPNDPRLNTYDYVLDTAYGPLDISVFEETVFSRFREHERIPNDVRFCLGVGHTGKWNEHFFELRETPAAERTHRIHEAVDYIESQFRRVLTPRPSKETK